MASGELVIKSTSLNQLFANGLSDSRFSTGTGIALRRGFNAYGVTDGESMRFLRAIRIPYFLTRIERITILLGNQSCETEEQTIRLVYRVGSNLTNKGLRFSHTHVKSAVFMFNPCGIRKLIRTCSHWALGRQIGWGSVRCEG